MAYSMNDVRRSGLTLALPMLLVSAGWVGAACNGDGNRGYVRVTA